MDSPPFAFGEWYHRGLLVTQQRYRYSDNNKNVESNLVPMTRFCNYLQQVRS